MTDESTAKELMEVCNLINRHAKCEGAAIRTIDFAAPVAGFAIQLTGEGQITSNGVAFRGNKVTIPLAKIAGVSVEFGASASAGSPDELGYCVYLKFSEPTMVESYAFRYGFESLAGPKPWKTGPWDTWQIQFQDEAPAREVADRLRSLLEVCTELPGASPGSPARDEQPAYRVVVEED